MSLSHQPALCHEHKASGMDKVSLQVTAIRNMGGGLLEISFPEVGPEDPMTTEAQVRVLTDAVQHLHPTVHVRPWPRLGQGLSPTTALFSRGGDSAWWTVADGKLHVWVDAVSELPVATAGVNRRQDSHSTHGTFPQWRNKLAILASIDPYRAAEPPSVTWKNDEYLDAGTTTWQKHQREDACVEFKRAGSWVAVARDMRRYYQEVADGMTLVLGVGDEGTIVGVDSFRDHDDKEKLHLQAFPPVHITGTIHHIPDTAKTVSELYMSGNGAGISWWRRGDAQWDKRSVAFVYNSAGKVEPMTPIDVWDRTFAELGDLPLPLHTMLWESATISVLLPFAGEDETSTAPFVLTPSHVLPAYFAMGELHRCVESAILLVVAPAMPSTLEIAAPEGVTLVLLVPPGRQRPLGVKCDVLVGERMWARLVEKDPHAKSDHGFWELHDALSSMPLYMDSDNYKTSLYNFFTSRAAPASASELRHLPKHEEFLKKVNRRMLQRGGRNPYIIHIRAPLRAMGTTTFLRHLLLEKRDDPKWMCVWVGAAVKLRDASSSRTNPLVQSIRKKVGAGAVGVPITVLLAGPGDTRGLASALAPEIKVIVLRTRVAPMPTRDCKGLEGDVDLPPTLSLEEVRLLCRTLRSVYPDAKGLDVYEEIVEHDDIGPNDPLLSPWNAVTAAVLGDFRQLAQYAGLIVSTLGRAQATLLALESLAHGRQHRNGQWHGMRMGWKERQVLGALVTKEHNGEYRVWNHEVAMCALYAANVDGELDTTVALDPHEQWLVQSAGGIFGRAIMAMCSNVKAWGVEALRHHEHSIFSRSITARWRDLIVEAKIAESVFTQLTTDLTTVLDDIPRSNGDEFAVVAKTKAHALLAHAVALQEQLVPPGDNPTLPPAEEFLPAVEIAKTALHEYQESGGTREYPFVHALALLRGYANVEIELCKAGLRIVALTNRPAAERSWRCVQHHLGGEEL